MAWPTVAWLPEGMILFATALALATDVADRIIPNRLVLLVLCAGIALRLLSSSPSPLWLSLLAPIAVAAAMSLLASRDLVGWGDAKLIAAVSVAVPADRLPTLLLAIALAGGLLSCLYLASRVVLQRIAAPAGPVPPDLERLPLLSRIANHERARILAGEPMPYAVAIFGGVAYTLATG
jgi:prepilin peptidase CpaA